MPARLSAFVIWILVALAAAFWSLRLLASPAPTPPQAVAVSEVGAARGDLTRLLGAEPVAVAAAESPASSRFKLLGVMAQVQSKGNGRADSDEAVPGFALISVDGKPARAFAAGAQIDDRLVLKSVSMRSASLGPAEGAASIVLEVPRLPAPATGSLPPIRMDGSSPTPAAAAAPQESAQNNRMPGMLRRRGMPQEALPQQVPRQSPVQQQQGEQPAQPPVDNDAEQTR
jgi:general secretion pathway protein C